MLKEVHFVEICIRFLNYLLAVIDWGYSVRVGVGGVLISCHFYSPVWVDHTVKLSNFEINFSAYLLVKLVCRTVSPLKIF